MSTLRNSPQSLARVILFCLILFFIVLFLSSCSPQKRLARLISKHPELVKADTVFRLDTTFVPGSSFDTVFKSEITRDTVIIMDKQFTIKYYNDGKHTFIKGATKPFFIVKKIPIIVNTVSVMPLDRKTRAVMWLWEHIWPILAGLMLLFFLLRKTIKLYLGKLTAFLK